MTQIKDEQIATLERALRRIDALYTDAQDQGNPYVSWMGAIARVALTNQPARDGGWDDTAPTLEFGYTNWRGEQSTRRVWPIRLWYGATEYHPDKQWFLKAFDTDKQAERDFALRDIRNLQPDQAALDVAQGRQTEAERRADALERERAADHTAFRSIKYHADNGHQDRPVHVRLRMISKTANERIDAALAQQEPDQPAQEWTAESAQAYIGQFDDDQPAQDDYPTGPPDSLPAGGHAQRLRPTSDQPAQDGGGWPVEQTTWRAHPSWMLASGLEGQPTLYRSEAPNEWTYMATLPDPGTLMALLIDSGHALGENYRNFQPDQPADAGPEGQS
jgi:hypothetical protein